MGCTVLYRGEIAQIQMCAIATCTDEGVTICTARKVDGLCLSQSRSVREDDDVKTNTDHAFLFRQFRDARHATPQARKAQGRGATQTGPPHFLTWLRSVWNGVNAFLNSLYRLHERNPAVMMEQRSDTTRLAARKVIRLAERTGIQRIHVRTGIIWLTSTPAGGDVILRAGEQYPLADGWPFVVEALEDARVDLLR